MRDRETWQDACGALGDLDKEKTHCSLRWEIEKLDKMLAGGVLGVGGAGPRPRKDTLVSKMRDRETWQDDDSFLAHGKLSTRREGKKKGGPVKGNEG
jgi:hypothetical protein